ncbi:MAG: hypothetical protein ACJAZP_001137 [Psychromonas sp.]|jgi:hypothetical protein|uniref:cysteine-rich CWC family protein n=1 Tax=Psychromonas sp. TaxID=1884585 RepID=UPI0039E27503
MLIDNNKTSCPFCDGVNECMAESASPCWCFEVRIPKSLMALLPVGFIGKSCICQTCINTFKENENLFKQKYSFKSDSKNNLD